jgi:hypothetical protein
MSTWLSLPMNEEINPRMKISSSDHVAELIIKGRDSGT